MTFPTAPKVHDDVQTLGNTGRSRGLSLEQFLDARGSLCYGAHLTCPTDLNDPFDPPSAEYPWLPFITDRCSIPEVAVQGPAKLSEWFKSKGVTFRMPYSILRMVQLAPYLTDAPVFDGQTVMFVYACMRHDFNWRNLYRVEHHLQHAGAWNLSTRVKADIRLRNDLLELCNANRPRSKPEPKYFEWQVSNSHIENCEGAVSVIHSAVAVWPFVKYGPDQV